MAFTMKTNTFINCVLPVGLLLALPACEKKQVQQGPPPAPPTVVVSEAAKRDVIPYKILTGNLEANQTVNVLPRVSSFVETIPFKPGEFIKAGTVLFTLDSRTFKAQLDQATAALGVAKSEVDVKKADLGVAKANLQNAADELDRQERLQKQNATSEKDLVNARNNHRAALANVEASTAAVTSATTAVDSATAAVAAADVNYKYCTITAPIAGKVDTNTVDLGDLVGPQTTKPLTTVREMDPLIADFSFPEGLIVEFLKKNPIQPGKKLAKPVKVSIGDENDFRFDATLNFVSNTFEQATGTIAAQAEVANKDLKLYPGLFVRVKVEIDPLPGAVLVNQDAVGRDIGGSFVWVIKQDDTAEKRYLKLGAEWEKQVIVASGLESGERYVVQGMQRVRDRAKVTTKLAGEGPATRPTVAAK